jgi:poly-beta-hydroxybutyrate-responsive repressor
MTLVMRRRAGSGRRVRGSGQGRARRKRGGLYLLEPTLLVTLRRGAAHGYSFLEELKTSGFADLDPSVVYRTLRQMELDGWVTSTWDKDQTQGPPRRVYVLSQLGEEILANWIDELREVNERITRLLKNSELNPKKGDISNA